MQPKVSLRVSFSVLARPLLAEVVTSVPGGGLNSNVEGRIAAGGMRFPDRFWHLRMRLPVTFRDQAEHEHRDYEQRYSSLSGSEAESLPHFIEFETPGLLNQVTNYYTDVLLGDCLNKSTSFVSQRFDRVEVGCSIGGVEAEADADD